MSYEIYLDARSGRVDQRRLFVFLNRRRNYTVIENEARYLNKETGVDFGIEFIGYTKESKDLGGPICFEINYFRPSFFALEADLELSDLVEMFDLVVVDSQIEGMGEGDYDSAGFLRGWRYGNRLAHAQVIERTGRANHFTLPTAKLERAWRWNYERPRLQQQAGDQLYVPDIMVLDLNGHAVTAVPWKDGLPFRTPPADYLLAIRERLKPRLFGFSPRDQRLVPWQQAAPLLADHGEALEDGSIQTRYDQPPKPVIDFVRRLKPSDNPRARIPLGEVMDEELILGQFTVEREAG